MKKKGFGFGVLVGFLGAIVLFVSIGAGVYFSTPSGKMVSDKTASKMNTIEKLIDAYYYGKIDQSKMEEGTYKGLVAGLEDKYSAYYTKEEYKKDQEDTAGQYVGVGAYVTRNEKNGTIIIRKPFAGSPAKKAGIKDGDIIAQVDGKNVTGRELSEVVSMIKGKAGTTVKIKLYDPKTKKYREVTVTRKKVDVPSVSSEMLDKKNKIGYIGISEFDLTTMGQFNKALNKLKKQKVKGIVFDVRYNPGGLYVSVCQMLDRILPKGLIAYTRDKYGNKEETKSDASCLKIPMVVLQNEASASGAELFAGAIQDYKLGKIVGTKSYGKGVVQNTYPLEDGSALHLTVKKYFTPSGRCIDGKGIEPDVKVEEGTKKDNQLEAGKKILLGEIKK